MDMVISVFATRAEISTVLHEGRIKLISAFSPTATLVTLSQGQLSFKVAEILFVWISPHNIGEIVLVFLYAYVLQAVYYNFVVTNAWIWF